MLVGAARRRRSWRRADQGSGVCGRAVRRAGGSADDRRRSARRARVARNALVRCSLGGFQLENDVPMHHASTWERGELTIDLHRNILPMGRGRIALDEVWARTRPDGPMVRAGSSPVDGPCFISCTWREIACAVHSCRSSMPRGCSSMRRSTMRSRDREDGESMPPLASRPRTAQRFSAVVRCRGSLRPTTTSCSRGNRSRDASSCLMSRQPALFDSSQRA